MSSINFIYQRRRHKQAEFHALPNADFATFNSDILGLGNISHAGSYKEALAAVFDLQDFTSFCNQIDPHLVVPEFLSGFLAWLFKQVASQFTKVKKQNAVLLWSPLPFYAKFIGDGVLFLWSTEGVQPITLGSIIISLNNIVRAYSQDFLPVISKSVTKTPQRLRCGIARGQIISVGEGRDFVGACINVAVRIQKLAPFTFAFSKRGFDIERHFVEKNRAFYSLVKTAIRGIGEGELVFVQKTELQGLPKDEQAKWVP